MNKIMLWEAFKSFVRWDMEQENLHPWLTRIRYVVTGMFLYVAAMAFGWI